MAKRQSMMKQYKILDEIGKGSYGTVFKAVKKHEKSECFAIKKVQCQAPENVELALQEFWTLSCLQKHLNIIRFEECFLENTSQEKSKSRLMQHGDTKSPSYLHLVEMSLKGKRVMHCDHYQLSFVMEYCDGGDLNDYLLSREPLASLNANFIMQMCDGIAFLHQNNVVHRDLKPENMLIRTTKRTGNNEPTPILKIADFGLAKVCSMKNCHSNDIHTCWFSSACGSDFFMAPEVFVGRYTAKADVFALGIMIWAIMDRLTFKDSNTNKLLLGTYVRRDKLVVPIGEALIDEPKLDLGALLLATGQQKPVVFAGCKTVKTECDGSTCVTGDHDQLRSLVEFMIDPNAEHRPTSHKLLGKLKTILSCRRRNAKKTGRKATIRPAVAGSSPTTSACELHAMTSPPKFESPNVSAIATADVRQRKLVRPPPPACLVARLAHHTGKSPAVAACEEWSLVKHRAARRPPSPDEPKSSPDEPKSSRDEPKTATTSKLNARFRALKRKTATRMREKVARRQTRKRRQRDVAKSPSKLSTSSDDNSDDVMVAHIRPPSTPSPTMARRYALTTSLTTTRRLLRPRRGISLRSGLSLDVVHLPTARGVDVAPRAPPTTPRKRKLAPDAAAAPASVAKKRRRNTATDEARAASVVASELTSLCELSLRCSAFPSAPPPIGAGFGVVAASASLLRPVHASPC